MKLLSINYKKISGEKLTNISPNMKINTKVDFSNIKVVQSEDFQFKEDVINLSFNLELEYDPGHAIVSVSADMLLALEKSQADDIIKHWAERKIPEDLRITLSNLILRKCGPKLLQITEDLNLPPFFQFPMIQKVGSSKNV